MALGNPEKGIEPVSIEIDHRAFAYLPGALEAARQGHLPGGLQNNRDFVGDCVVFGAGVREEYRHLLFDPQTSGGLLVAIREEAADAAQRALDRHGVSSSRVGGVRKKTAPLLHVK